MTQQPLFFPVFLPAFLPAAQQLLKKTHKNSPHHSDSRARPHSRAADLRLYSYLMTPSETSLLRRQLETSPLMKAAVFESFGEPADVLQIRELPEPKPGPGQVRVRLLASPINPSDLLMVAGRYGRQPPLPATPGFEGVGIVEEAGGGLMARLKVGKRVAVLNGQTGNWQEQVIVPWQFAVPIGVPIADEQAASFFVNPASALIMIQDVLRVAPGAWVLQTAAGSALGKMVIRLGRHFGFKTINVVRRREQAQELLDLGGDAAIATNDESLEDRVRELTGGQGVRYALDAVGGATGSAVVRALGNRGHLLVYGTLSEEPVELHPRMLMVGQKRIEGFWLAEWSKAQSKLTMLRLFRRIRKLLAANVVTSEVEATFGLEDIKAAVARAAQPGRRGKVILKMKVP
jgi:NADPH:quinone reductase-like Zn-dependent oxidoreductase